MKLIHIIKNEPIKNFIGVTSEKDDIKCACVCQKVMFKAEYECLSKVDRSHALKSPFAQQIDEMIITVERERIFNLASIYYREIDGVKKIFDIHYHSGKTLNGFRTEDCVVKDTNAILEDNGYVLDLVVGGFMGRKRRVKVHTRGVKHVKKTYKKLYESE